MSSQYYSATAYVGTPHRNEVEVTIPLVGPQGPAGEAGAGAVESVNGQTGVVVLAAADVGAASTSHTHGNLTNAGAIGTTSGLPVKTGTSGVIEAGAFGTAAGQFAEGNHTHAASAITSGVFDYARMAHVAQVNLFGDDETLNAGDYATNGNIIAHLRLRPEVADASITVTLPDLTSTSVGEVTLRAIRGGQDLQYAGFFLSVIDDNDAPIFGNPTEIDADEELTFRWNNGRWDMDLRPNPFATTAAFSIFKPNSSGTLALNPMTTAGDIVVGGTSGAPARLALGTASQQLRVNSGQTSLEYFTPPAELVIACSDETSNLTTGTAKVTFRMPYAMTLSSVRASVNTAPTGSTLVVDINEGGSTILSTKLSIDASELTSTTAATAAVISDTALADDAEVTIDIDQIGSTIAGKGLKVVLKGTRA